MMKQIIEGAVFGAVAGGAMTVGRVSSDPDGWNQVALGVVLFAIAGAVIAIVRQAWRSAGRFRRPS
jgi:hypothetical protein